MILSICMSICACAFCAIHPKFAHNVNLSMLVHAGEGWRSDGEDILHHIQFTNITVIKFQMKFLMR